MLIAWAPASATATSALPSIHVGLPALQLVPAARVQVCCSWKEPFCPPRSLPGVYMAGKWEQRSACAWKDAVRHQSLQRLCKCKLCLSILLHRNNPQHAHSGPLPMEHDSVCLPTCVVFRDFWHLAPTWLPSCLFGICSGAVVCACTCFREPLGYQLIYRRLTGYRIQAFGTASWP